MTETSTVNSSAMTDLRSNGTTTFSWKYTTLVVNKDNLKDFVLLSNRRDIRTGKVSKIAKVLKKGGHFETPLVVNISGKGSDRKMRLIDGNHRHLAMERFFKEYPNRNLKIAVNYYEDLSEREERDQYTKWNSGTKQTTNDFIKQYWDEVTVFKKMQVAKGFPVDVGPSWATRKLEAKLLLNAYFSSFYTYNAVTGTGYAGPSMIAGPEFIERCKQLETADIAKLKAFLTDYTTVFGIPDNSSQYYRPAVFSAVADIWFKNASNEPDMIKRMKKIIGHKTVVDWAAGSGTLQNCQFARRDFLQLMNGSSSKNLLT